MVIETKSHPKVAYLDMNNFHDWAIDAVYASNLESDSLDKNFHTNDQQKCTDCLKARSNKNKHECKNVVAITFVCLIIKVFHLQHC